jgi:RNA polymerase sigma-70 factor, ECF subfamily
MRNVADAEDAMQEHYLRALHHFDSYHGPAMKPWLLAILKNVCNAEFARRGTEPIPAECDEAEPTPEQPPLWQEPQSSPEAELLRWWDGQALRRLVAALPQPFREAIVLREINNLTYCEIAEVAGVPLGTVMSRLGRARTMLRRGLERRGRIDDMNCAESEVLLHALIDGELDAGHARDVEAHVAACPACADKLRAFRAMREAMAAANLKETASASLRSRLDAALPPHVVRADGPRTS